MKKQFKTFPLQGQLSQLLGQPERTGHWFVYGESGHGKTTFLMQLAKELSFYEKVEYNSLEEGARLSMQLAVQENKMHECRSGSFKILDKMQPEELIARLIRPRSAKIIIIDSLQYMFMDKRQFADFDKQYGSTHLIIWNSHANGRHPIGALAEAVMFHADQKVYVHGFKAYSKSRTSRGKVTAPYTIWHEGADNFNKTI